VLEVLEGRVLEVLEGRVLEVLATALSNPRRPGAPRHCAAGGSLRRQPSDQSRTAPGPPTYYMAMPLTQSCTRIARGRRATVPGAPAPT
jgi:hypothetical protein